MPRTSHHEQPPSAPVLYLVAPTGHPNFGDEFIAAAWLRHLAAVHPEAEVWLDCTNPGQAAHLVGSLHPRVRFTDTLWRLIVDTTAMDPVTAGAHIDRVITDLGSPRYDLGLLALRRAGSVHLLGGGYINAIWPHHAGLLRAARRLKELTGAELYATGLGLFPAADGTAVREALAAFDHATVRDAPSAELAGVAQGPDDAFLGLEAVPGFTGHPVQDGEPDRDVWVCLQSDTSSPGAAEAAVAAVRAALEGPLAGRTVRYLEAIPGADRTGFEQLADLIPAEHFVPFTQVWLEGFPARPGQTWLTTRFHFHLLAAACGAAGTALEVSDDYYRTKHRSLLEAGTGWTVTAAGEHRLSTSSAAVSFPAIAAALREEKLAEARTLYPGGRHHGDGTHRAAPESRHRGWFHRR
ncbi:polysaccharide pyruvyl transferase family protein [Kocuria sp. LUK]|uniref:polysaccharide pyruvyl transferase family protein n=1 Tax=Kocuria sp. LUK TaxID=2897828 RepID=UPI001E5A498B|nr:polysaccharide pyruvyl transferase family protein [Kocuria sp. LUK]MCD1143918.1 polysaccharide pyruvyl transferase family protein [Kocuria sp. LUK]